MVLAFAFPSHFLYKDVIRELIDMLSIKMDAITPLALKVLGYIGRHKPLGDVFSDVLQLLVPICKRFIAEGTPKEAKEAVTCLFINTTDTQVIS